MGSDMKEGSTVKCKGLPVNFKEWRAIAEYKSKWRSRKYSKPMPPSEN